jgi:NADPH:quinone reductase-like Zn-dependent oxidoreductase
MPDRYTPKVALINRPIPTPNFDKNQHLIKVHATAPCSGELLWPAGFPEREEPNKVLVPCDDLAGTIVSAPPNSPFKAGDEIYARTNFNRAGNAADYTIGLTEELAIKPKNLSWAEAASVSLSVLTAWQALFSQAGLGDFGPNTYKGKRILVTAAAGGVGQYMVQLGRLSGAEVVGTAGPDNIDFVKSLGALEVLNYRTTDFKAWAEAEGKKVDLVIDCVGNKSLEDAWWTVKDGGIMMSICQPPEQQIPAGYTGKDVRNSFWIMHPDGPTLSKITLLLEEGKLKPTVDSVFPLEKFEEAFKRVDSGHARGKVVFDLDA